MSRRRKADKREVIPDPKFGDIVITKFMNSIMKEGKKSAAERIVYGALSQMEKKAKQNPVELFHEALRNVMPALEVRSRRVGGATYQVPVEVRTDRRQALAIRWIISAARDRNENTMVERLSGELLDAAINRGTAVKKRETRTAWRTPTAPSRITAGNGADHAASYPPRGLPQYRDHGAYRRRQDHDHRADPLLHGQEPQDRRGARRRCHHGLDGAGAGARHHHHLGRDHGLLERQAHQHHRHAGPRRFHHRSRALLARARRRGRTARRQPGR